MEWVKRRAAKILGRGKIGCCTEAAEKCNVVRETISHWQKIPEFRKLMEEEKKKQESILDAAADDIDRKTVESAKIKGREGAPDRRLYYQLLGKLVDRQQIAVDPLVIVRPEKAKDFPPEELKKMGEAACGGAGEEGERVDDGEDDTAGD